MNDMSVTCDTAKVLDILKENRETHRKMVHEARKGFVEEAHKMLKDSLKKLKAGKLRRLSLSLQPPEDHTTEYDTAITMLELHTKENIVLTAGDVRRYIEDEWSWTRGFLLSNRRFSGTAAAMAVTKYGHEDEGW